MDRIGATGELNMAVQCEVTAKHAAGAPMSVFERYLTVWVFVCIVVGIVARPGVPRAFQAIGRMEVAKVNLPVGLLIWVMIIPMLVKVDFTALHEVRQHVRGIGVTLFVNWLVKPFSMALLAWIFIRHLFAPWLPAEQIDSYIAGLILLAAAPCTAMVFVWSRLTNGDPMFTLIAGCAERLDHGRRVRTARGTAARHRGDHRAVGHADHLGRAVHRDAGDHRAAVAPLAAAPRGRRCSMRRWPDRAVVDRGAAADAGVAFRLPGQGDHRASRS